jgi:hypothetical protein
MGTSVPWKDFIKDPNLAHRMIDWSERNCPAGRRVKARRHQG